MNQPHLKIAFDSYVQLPILIEIGEKTLPLCYLSDSRDPLQGRGECVVNKNPLKLPP